MRYPALSPNPARDLHLTDGSFRTCRKMSGKPTSDDEAPSSKKKKRSGPSLLQLEREKYLKSGASSGSGASASGSKTTRGKRKAGGDEEDLMSVLEGFRSKISEAARSAPALVAGMEVDENAGGKSGGEKEGLHGIDVTEEDFEEDVRCFLAFRHHFCSY